MPRKNSVFLSGSLWTVGVLVVVAVVAFLALRGSPQPSAPGGDPMAGAGTEISRKSNGEYIPVGAVSVSEQQVDVGHLPLNKLYTYTFKVRNTSDELVRLGQGAVNMLEGC